MQPATSSMMRAKRRGATGCSQVIEERKRVPSRTDLPNVERERLDKALKVLANAASCGNESQRDRP
jgi:hypothetical protein